MKVAPGGAQTAVSITGLADNSLSMPQGVAVDAAGNLFVADRNNERIVEVPVGGGTAKILADGHPAYSIWT
jgi:DNA-binding beta-propeller fold protein YncE